MIYADNAATTRISENVLNAMLPVLRDAYGNPSSLYDFGSAAKKIIEEARQQVADSLGSSPREIYFTSGGTESDNWAIKGSAPTLRKKGKTHIVSTAIEHPAVLASLESLESQGFDITLLGVDSDGIVQPDQLRQALRDDTGLVSVMFANNEIGTIQPIRELGEICREREIWFHTDAVQMVGHTPINLRELPVDLLSISGHKVHAAKGVGALFLRKGIHLDRFLDGGGQERGCRAGTENTAAIAGFGVAMQSASSEIEQRNIKITELRERFIDGVLQIGRCQINGDRNRRLPGNVNVRFENVEGESLVLMLDMHGICVSTGSACSSGSLDASHVLLAMGLTMESARSSIRLTFSEENTPDEIDFILDKLESSLKKLRGTLRIVRTY
jgi:cysteine desulfurase